MDALAQAQAVKNCGGTVIVQVKQLVGSKSLAPSQVRIPGFLVDYIVIAAEEEHPQTYGKSFDASFTSRTAKSQALIQQDIPLAKLIIADRAALELGKHRRANVNLGIGIPALIGVRASKLESSAEGYILTVESGTIGGVPDQGLSFGAAMNPEAVIEQSSMFDFYDGGGIDIAFLGFGEVDARGNVNVSRLGEQIPGAGGFINISQASKKIVFCGTLTAGGLKIEAYAGQILINQEGQIKKFVPQVFHLTFNGEMASNANKEVLYITERAVFSLQKGQLHLIEIAPGVTVNALRLAMSCDFIVSDHLILMPNFALQQYAFQREGGSLGEFHQSNAGPI
jgi:propionate CoA-transferase